jgi:fermentation-respiration switch protein FrsA (DUF1100 family)
VLDHVKKWRRENDHTGRLIVMGRSLGSASALELAGRRGDDIDALIIESGFAHTAPLLKILGLDPADAAFCGADPFSNIDKIGFFDKPTLIIHAQWDHLIPFSEGRALYDASPAREKNLLKIDGADHNNILAVGFNRYLSAVLELARVPKPAGWGLEMENDR